MASNKTPENVAEERGKTLKINSIEGTKKNVIVGNLEATGIEATSQNSAKNLESLLKGVDNVSVAAISGSEQHVVAGQIKSTGLKL